MVKRLISLILLVSSLCFAMGVNAEVSQTKKPYYRVDTYTDSFATRFGLPKLPKADQPTNGIEAMEFYAEPDIQGRMRCYSR